MRKKICTRCKTEKSIRCFAKRKPRRKGLMKVQTVDQRVSHCKECARKLSRERRLSKPKLCKALRRKAHLLRKHEITVEVYEEMFERQSGKCKICGTTDPGHKRKYLAVDHNHETGDIRGLLCYQCNLGLGHFQDDTAILQKAILYLSTNQT